MPKKSRRGRNNKQSKQSARNRNGSQSKRSTGTGRYIFDSLVAMVRPMVNTEKEWGVERITELANATQEYATSLEETPNLAGYATKAAESLQEFADYVNENEFDQILKDSTEYAKRNPIAVIIGGALAGLVLTQMLRSNGAASTGRGQSGKRPRRAQNGNVRPNGRSSGEAIRLNA